MIPPGAGEVLLAALAGGAATVERKAFLQSMVSRPIVVGPLVGWALGDPVGGLFVGAPLELVWSGAANLGAALPHHETAATAAIAAAAVAAGLNGTGVGPAIACAAFALLAPLALAGRKLEAIGERANEDVVARAAVAMGEGMAIRGLRMHLGGLWRPLVASAAATAFAALVVGPAISQALLHLPEVALSGLRLGWALIWAVGGASAVRAARLPLGVALAVGGAAAALALWGVTLLVGW